jgi:DNA polymerase I-like protein with 3'-5' exonuclease and polymerase domains
MQTLHIAVIFEACRQVKPATRSPFTHISAKTLQLAIAHVDECLLAALFLDQIANRAPIASEADILLEKIRNHYYREARRGSIILTRTDLTSRYCHNSGRSSCLKPNDLYLRLIPALERQNKARVIQREGNRPLYAFRVSEAFVFGGGGEENAEKEESSPAKISRFSLNSPISSVTHQNPTTLKPTRPDKVTLRIDPGVGDEAEENEERAATSPTPTVTLEEFAAGCSPGQCPLAMDIETYGDNRADALNSLKGEIRLITLQREDKEPVLFDLKQIEVDPQVLKKLLERQQLIIHNARFDLEFLAKKFGICPRRIFCTLSAARVLTNGDRSMLNDLGTVLNRELGITLLKDQATSDWGGLFLTEDQLRYAANDVRYLHALRLHQTEQLEAQRLSPVFNLEMVLIPVIIGMERTGFAVDPRRLAKVLMRTKMLLKAPQNELASLFGEHMNLESPEQLKQALAGMKIEVQDTSETTLRALKQPVAELILRYRGLEAQRRQAQTLLDNTSSEGRIHATFDPLGTETGRFSSRDPNLQNVGRGELRGCFVPGSEGYRLVVADYNQVELRVAAYFANDESMLDAFRAGADLHAQTAAVVLGKKPADLRGADRQVAKAVNFGLLYGQGPKGLVTYTRAAYGMELTEEEAADIRTRFFNHYEGLAAWHKTAWESAPSLTEGRTVLNRRRLLSPDAPIWQRFLVQINFVVQGSCADTLKLAMIYLAQGLPEGAQLVATVHDELVIEAPESIAEQVRSTTIKAMRDAFEKLFPGVPIDVQAKICKRWSEK